MTTLTNARSSWNYADLERDILKRITESATDYGACSNYATNTGFQSEISAHLHRFLNSLPNGEIVSDGYFRGFRESTEPRKNIDFNARVMSRLGDIHDDQVGVMATSEISIIRLMQQGGSWAERVYQAIPEVVDKLLDRATTAPGKKH